MKIISFLSKFTFICNIAFLFFVFFRWMEMQKAAVQSNDKLVQVFFIKNIVITLGFTAIIFNIAMNLIYVIYILSGKRKMLPFRIMLFNFILLLLQLYYFF